MAGSNAPGRLTNAMNHRKRWPSPLTCSLLSTGEITGGYCLLVCFFGPLFVCLFVWWLFVCLLVWLCICLFVCLFVCVFVFCVIVYLAKHVKEVGIQFSTRLRTPDYMVEDYRWNVNTNNLQIQCNSNPSTNTM